MRRWWRFMAGVNVGLILRSLTDGDWFAVTMYSIAACLALLADPDVVPAADQREGG